MDCCLQEWCRPLMDVHGERGVNKICAYTLLLGCGYASVWVTSGGMVILQALTESAVLAPHWLHTSLTRSFVAANQPAGVHLGSRQKTRRYR